MIICIDNIITMTKETYLTIIYIENIITMAKETYPTIYIERILLKCCQDKIFLCQQLVYNRTIHDWICIT